MGGGGPSSVQNTSTTSLPAWLQPYANAFMQTYMGQVTGQPQAGSMPLRPYDPAMNTTVAPFTQAQQTGMGAITGAATPSANLAAGNAAMLGNTIGGQYLNPATNPYLDATYQAASRGLVNQYQTAIAPSLMTAAQRAGVSGGSAEAQQRDINQYGLGVNLSDLATQIYGGNYAAERQRQMQASGLVPTAQGALVQPGASVLGVGTLQQSQAQAAADAATRNAIAQNQYPFTLLSGFGSAIGTAGGGTGTMVGTGPNPGAAKGF